MPRLKNAGNTKQRKKCVKPTAYPCGFSCIARYMPNGKERLCRNRLRGQAESASLWLKQVEERLTKINTYRSSKGKDTFALRNNVEIVRVPATRQSNSDRPMTEKRNRTTEDTIKLMTEIGGRRWTKNDYDRIYFDGSLIASLLDLSNSKARQINASKFFYDLKSGQFHYSGTSVYGVTDSPMSGEGRPPNPAYWVGAIAEAIDKKEAQLPKSPATKKESISEKNMDNFTETQKLNKSAPSRLQRLPEEKAMEALITAFRKLQSEGIAATIPEKNLFYLFSRLNKKDDGYRLHDWNHPDGKILAVLADAQRNKSDDLVKSISQGKFSWSDLFHSVERT